MPAQPRCTWRMRLCALYCVAMPMRRMPELTQFDSVKSMMRNLPPNGTAGFARQSVSARSRSPRPPASTIARVWRVSCEMLRVAPSSRAGTAARAASAGGCSCGISSPYSMCEWIGGESSGASL